MMTKAKRTGKIFLDFFRNTRGATSVAAFSSRSRPGAPVSTPLSWEELPALQGATAYTVKTVPARLGALKADPWKGFFDVRQSLSASARRSLGMKPPAVL
jgi:bifunctional non-homologous end joining protein LigD